MSLNYVFSSKLYHARTQQGYTQAQVAEAVGVSLRWYVKLEKGIKFPNGVILIRLVLLLGLELEPLRKYAGLLEPGTARRGAYV